MRDHCLPCLRPATVGIYLALIYQHHVSCEERRFIVRDDGWMYAWGNETTEADSTQKDNVPMRMDCHISVTKPTRIL